MDVVDRATRSRMMSGIRGTNTKPETTVRSYLHAAGFRFRKNSSGLPGRPDLVLRKHNAAIFIHGCFWHGHGCHLFKWPSTRESFWVTKIVDNQLRDVLNFRRLRALGWRTLVVWECRLRQERAHTLSRVAQWLLSSSQEDEIGSLDETLCKR